jgi:hypothetical protein
VRLDGEPHDLIRKWADDELRSVNGQIEFLLRKALRDAGRLPQRGSRGETAPPPENTNPTETSEAEPGIDS